MSALPARGYIPALPTPFRRNSLRDILASQGRSSRRGDSGKN